MTVLDIHSHRAAPYPRGIISIRDFDAPLIDNQLYSAGIHPWDAGEDIADETIARFEELAQDPAVVMIGECGIDLLKGAPMFRQLQVLRRHVDVSERLRKPLIIHCVKGADIILGLKRDLNPSQPWIIHGFRGKPALARQLTDKGIYLSFGDKFNADAVRQVPADMIFAETDESTIPIEEIIDSLSQAAGCDLLPSIKTNLRKLIPGVNREGHDSPEKMLERAGVKPTVNRVLVLKSLIEAPQPMSLIEIENRLETIERSSVSRVLGLLLEHDVIHSFEDGRGVSKYELCHGETHCSIDDMHAHFYCERCERTFCFEDITAPRINVPSDFKIRSVNYMLKGLCPECAKICDSANDPL